MTSPLLYKTGTAAVINGSAVVTGSGTAWAIGLVTGGSFSCAGMSIPIESVESDTSLTLAYDWPGSTAAAQAYAIARETSEAVRTVWTNDRLAQIITRMSLVGIHPDGSGTLTQRDALSPTPATGYLWLHAEPGIAFEFYRKTDSGWEGPFPVEGADGNDGAPGIGSGGYGLPVGGAPGQVPAKVSGTDGDVAWVARREVLTANRTYYVRTDGSNSNTGLVDSAGGAFLTIQKAADVVFGTLDLGNYSVTIAVADGTYTAGVVASGRKIGSGTITIQGNLTTPSNCLVSMLSGDCFYAGNGADFIVTGFKLVNAGGSGLRAINGGAITWGTVEFGACSVYHVRCNEYGIARASANYSITGNASRHWDARDFSYVVVQSRTVTITGAIAFTNFAHCDGSRLTVNNNTFSGSATGSRYSVVGNGTIQTLGAGASYLPGDAVGSSSTGGQYI